jgi:hypothetical protein
LNALQEKILEAVEKLRSQMKQLRLVQDPEQNPGKQVRDKKNRFKN